MCEQGGDGTGLEEPGPMPPHLHSVVVVSGLKVLLADEELVEDGRRSVNVHAEGCQPAVQPRRVPDGKTVEDEVVLFDAAAALHAACVNHVGGFDCKQVWWTLTVAREIPTHAHQEKTPPSGRR